MKYLEKGRVEINAPAATLALLRLNAVIGVKGVFQGDSPNSVGITCAICHSTVDDSLAPGIGSRLDGWANRTNCKSVVTGDKSGITQTG